MSETNSDPIAQSPDETHEKHDLQTALSQAGAERTVEELKSPDAAEERKAYGTAKTEDLRDTGVWRILLAVVLVLLCLALFATPLMILTPLFLHSLDPSAAANQKGIPLTWMWITMVVIEVLLAVLIIRGLLKIFFTQAGNYRR